MPNNARGWAREDGKVAIKSSTGDLFWVEPSEVPDAIQQGYELPSPEEGRKLQRSNSTQEAVIAHLQGAAKTYFGGATEWLGSNVGELGGAGKAETEAYRKRWLQPREEHETAFTAGELGAYLIPGGIFGKIGKGVTSAAKAGLGKLATHPGILKAAAGTAGAAAEGAAIGQSQALSDIAAHHEEMDSNAMREHLINSTAAGISVMAGTHLAGTGISTVMRRVKKATKGMLEPGEITALKEARKETMAKISPRVEEYEDQLQRHMMIKRTLNKRLLAYGIEEGEIAALENAGVAGTVRIKAGPRVSEGTKGIMLRRDALEAQRNYVLKRLGKLDKAMEKGKASADKEIGELWKEGIKLTKTINQLKEEVGTGIVGRVVANTFGIFAGTAGAMGAGELGKRLVSGGYGVMASRSLAWRAFRFLQPKIEKAFVGRPLSAGGAFGGGFKIGQRHIVNELSERDFRDIMERLELDNFRFSDVSSVSPVIAAALDAKKDQVTQHIMSVAPQPAAPSANWQPSRKQLQSFSKTMRAVTEGPNGILETLGDKGYIDRESMAYLKVADPETAFWLQSVARGLLASGNGSPAQMAAVAIILEDMSLSSGKKFSKIMRLQSLYEMEQQSSASRAQMKFPGQAQTTMQGIESRSAAA